MAPSRWVFIATVLILAAFVFTSCGSDSGGPSLTGTGPPPPPGSSDAEFDLLMTGSIFLDMIGVDGEQFICGEKGLVLHDDGTGWEMQKTPEEFSSLLSIWGPSADNVWAVGEDGTMLHFDGSAWTDVAPGGFTTQLNGVWGASASEAWAVGRGGTILRFTAGWRLDGESTLQSRPTSTPFMVPRPTTSSRAPKRERCSPGTAPTWTVEKARPNGLASNSPLRDMWVAPTGEMYFVTDTVDILSRSATGTWSAVDTRQLNPLYCVWGTSADNVYAAGFNGRIIRYNGSSWSVQTSDVFGSSLQSVWGTGADDIYAVGREGTITQFDGTSWNLTVQGRGSRLKTMWGTSANHLHIVGQDGVAFQYDGMAFEIGSVPNTDYHDSFGFAADNIYAVGATGIIHYNGTNWSSEYSSGPLYGIWGSGPDYIVAVGINGAYIRYNGTSWTSLAVNGTEFQYGIWGADQDNLFITMAGGKVAKADAVTVRTTWDENATGTTADLLAAWGTSASNVFIVGKSGTILHFDGSSFSTMPSGVTSQLNAVWGSGGNDVWAAGSGGTVLHYDGNSWGQADIGASLTVHDVFGFSATDVFISMDRGTILELR